MNTTSLIVADMTEEDFDNFHAAGICFSGSTGRPGVSTSSYPYPYIATYLGELERIVVSLKWPNFSAERHGSQWTIRKCDGNSNMAVTFAMMHMIS